MNARLALIAASAALLSGCVSLDPEYERPPAPTPSAWPQGPAYAPADPAASTALPAWRAFYADEKLRALIELSLEQNRDLRIAAANIERARALYGVQRAQSLPNVEGALQGQSQQTPVSAGGTGDVTRQYSASVGITAFELDFFGRVRSLNRSALQSYLATQAARDSAQIALISEVATRYLAYAGDLDLLRLARETYDAQSHSLMLTQRRYDAGASSLLDLRRAQTTVEAARADVARYTTLTAQDYNALALVVGAPIADDLKPTSIETVNFGAQTLPPGLPSDVLLTRPDIVSAEHELQAAYSDIGAARAAFFPSVSISGTAGQVDPRFENLFSGADGAWSFTPRVSLPLFDAGARRGRLGAAEADRDIAVASYERAIQAAFREVADALAERGTIDERVTAQQSLTSAASDAFHMSEARFQRGVDNYLSVLDAQRELYGAQQALVNARVDRAVNLVTLYKTLGGGL